MPQENPGTPHEILVAKLRALRTKVGQRLLDPRAKYFDPAVVLEYFTTYAGLASGFRSVQPEFFDDLPVRELPRSSETTDNDGRGYIVRRHLQVLAEDVDYILEVGDHMSTKPPVASNAQIDRRFMELAVTEAAKSVSEPSRRSPKVGAVIARGADLVATAFRGELKEGEHAEFTALEGKCQALTLAGSTVYTTLEPCTARNPPKLPCVERLIARKVSRVVIGMLDPNDVIRGRGILILRRANIEVGLFPPDLMSRLEEMNRDFIGDHENGPSVAKKVEEPEDKWVNTTYVESSGIAQRLQDRRFELCWVRADEEADHLDFTGWQHVIHEQDGKKYRLKIRDESAGGYLVLLMKSRGTG